MTNDRAKSITINVFDEIKKAITTKQIDSLMLDELTENKMDSESYPFLDFSLNSQEIEQLISKGIFNEEKNLVSGFSERKDLTTIEKLLYSVLWKNGDLKKMKHIVEGVQNAGEVTTDRKKGLVFYQFGKFLTKTGHPIIDQHVLRAFSLFKNTDEDKVDSIRKKGTITKRDNELIEEYKKWLNEEEGLTSELKSQPNYLYHIDQLLFALGKTIKKSK